MKCFCGNDAKYKVKVWNEGINKFLDHPRCEECTERAKNSYKEVEIKEIKISK